MYTYILQAALGQLENNSDASLDVLLGSPAKITKHVRPRNKEPLVYLFLNLSLFASL